MATVGDIVTAALRKIGVVAEDEPASADAMAQGVTAYNHMLHGWSLKSVNISHTDQVSSDTFALTDGYIEPTVYLLAAKLAENYSVGISFDPDPYWKTILAAKMTIPEVTISGALTDMPSQRNRNYQTPER